MKGSVSSIESFGAVDGPGIRTVIFLNGCLLRCKYCHNPEMWTHAENNMTPEEIVNKVKRNKPYFNNGKGGVTFSGGEPLLQPDFLITTCKLLKEEGIHIALDTSGTGIGRYEEILPYIDLIILDIKDVTKNRFTELTSGDITKSQEFLKVARQMHKEFWVRQVIVPGVHDSEEYMHNLNTYIEEHLDKSCISRIEFLPYHKLGSEKYEKLNINNPYINLEEMNAEKCQNLYNTFMEIYNQK